MLGRTGQTCDNASVNGVLPCSGPMPRRVLDRRARQCLHDACEAAPTCFKVETMNAAADTDRRLSDLEIKLGLADDMLDQLNKTLFRQQQMIERLARELGELRQQVPDSAGGSFRSLRDEIPPHY